ncbi:LysR family transcriptional regulator [Moritella sp. 24]|uniref:LysR family transcriptional regulator n=1 Tax=Moritella sp. 24 TaxID=2746230 RepID=UPI001BA764F5|nr:LysR family transcriptional regulator [Moritella sp. 24]QUM76161.1 LysR family transcriptional regulator [Moritella sp. 24]
MMRHSLQAITAFVKTASLGSFASAAKDLEQTPASISKQVKKLEQQLGTRLLNRTTRSLSLTDEGKYLYNKYRAALALLDSSSDWLDLRKQQPSGKLRVSMPQSIGLHVIMPLIPKFKTKFPHIEVELFFDDNVKDPISHGFDVGIRGGGMPSSGLIARKLVPMQFFLCATPEYLASKPRITSPADLVLHQQVRFRLTGNGKVEEWTFEKSEETFTVTENTVLTVNTQDAMCDAILAHMGIGFLDVFNLKPYVDSGKLVYLLPQYHSLDQDRYYHLYYPNRENLAAKVRVFIDFVIKHVQVPVL